MRQASASALRDGVVAMVAEAMEQTTTAVEDWNNWEDTHEQSAQIKIVLN